jgi:hypothetical protein
MILPNEVEDDDDPEELPGSSIGRSRLPCPTRSVWPTNVDREVGLSRSARLEHFPYSVHYGNERHTAEGPPTAELV